MASYLFSTLANAQVVGFDPRVDQLTFSGLSLSAADISLTPSASGRATVVSAPGKSITLDTLVPGLFRGDTFVFDDGSRVFVQNTALRVASLENSQRIMNGQPVNPDEVYFRCQPKLEATTPEWAWLSESQFIGVGRRAPDGVFMSFYRVC